MAGVGGIVFLFWFHSWWPFGVSEPAFNLVDIDGFQPLGREDVIMSQHKTKGSSPSFLFNYH